MKKVLVLQLDLHDNKEKQKALKRVSTLLGIDFISMDMKGKKLTVIGDVDPVNIVSKLRKFWKTDVISVAPVKEPEKKEEPKKEEPKKEEPKKEEAQKEDPKKEEPKKEEPKKEESKKEEPKKEEKKIDPNQVLAEFFNTYRVNNLHPYNPNMAYNLQPYNPNMAYHPHIYNPPMIPHYHVQNAEENPNSCAIF